MNLNTKEERLREIFRELDSVIVAYSGGVDSSYVAYVANAELGPRAVCITGQSASLPEYQRAEIDSVVQKFGFQHEVIQTEELENPGHSATAPGQSAEKNAAKACKAERALGVQDFKDKYGTNVNKANAFGKCVSQLAKAHGSTS